MNPKAKYQNMPTQLAPQKRAEIPSSKMRPNYFSLLFSLWLPRDNVTQLCKLLFIEHTFRWLLLLLHHWILWTIHQSWPLPLPSPQAVASIMVHGMDGYYNIKELLINEIALTFPVRTPSHSPSPTIQRRK